MTAHTTYRRRAACALALALTAALTLCGCAAGQDAQTAKESSVVDGSAADIGPIGIRNVGIAAPSDVAGYKVGDDAPLYAAIVNNSITADKLTSVTSVVATSVRFSASSSASEPASATPTGSATESPTPVPAGSPSAGSSPAGTPITIPANGLVSVGGDSGGFEITLLNLTRSLIPGQSVPVTFTFESAGSTTVQLPVAVIQDSTGGQTIDVEPSGQG